MLGQSIDQRNVCCCHCSVRYQFAQHLLIDVLVVCGNVSKPVSVCCYSFFFFSTKRYHSGNINFIDDVLPHTAAAANAAAAVALRPGIVSPCYVQFNFWLGLRVCT